MSERFDYERLCRQLREFARERDWEQFHTPKNLVMALSVETAELMEIFQWLTPEQAKAVKNNSTDIERVGEEVADILMYLTRFIDVMELDLQAICQRKLELNRERYPVETSKGNANKSSK